MEGAVPVNRAWPVAGSAPLACLQCRRLKMRCVGAENPPCLRCTKARRECQVQPSRRGYQKQSTPPEASRPRASAKRSRKADGPRLDLSDQRIVDIPNRTPPNVDASSREHVSRPINHAIGTHKGSPGSQTHRPYTESLIAAVCQPTSTSHPTDTRAVSNGLSSNGHRPQAIYSTLVSDDTLLDLLNFFRKKLIYFFPVIDESELEDLPTIVQHKRSLAYTASLVASEFVPGGATVRKALIPYVAEFLADLEGPISEDQDTVWTQLQSYAILYAYRPSTDITHPTLHSADERRLNHWRIKSAVEDFAMRLGLHHALDEVRALVRAREEKIRYTHSFRKAVYWLWLFTMSHHFSLVTETPPTIRQDSSIKTACALFSGISKPPQVTRMLAEVDLCMLWNLADQALPGLGEWWLREPEVDINPAQAAHVLEDADAALDVWSRRWGVHGETDATYPGLDINMNGAVEFHFRATRFWMRLFATRMVHFSQSTVNHDADFSELNAKLTIKSAEAAECCCRYLMEIDALARDGARYMADLGFALITFCGMYVVRIYEMYGRQYPILHNYLTSVEGCGKMLTEMAVGSNQVPLHYGRRVLERVANAALSEVSGTQEVVTNKTIEGCRNDMH